MVLGFLAVTVLGVAVYGYTIYQQGTETLSKKRLTKKSGRNQRYRSDGASDYPLDGGRYGKCGTYRPVGGK